MNSRRTLAFERLEAREVLTSLPYGAMPEDTGEFMLGDVLVTLVLMESNEQLSSVNDNSENWTAEAIAEVKQKVAEGLDWWSLALGNITDKHQLNFQIDHTFADNPVSTSYEPITRPSSDFQSWIYDFLDEVGFNDSGDFSTDIRAFNHAQREAHSTNWAFTIFVVNDQNDPDGQFAPGGFSRAFAFSGGRFFVMPAGRPASTVAHETGHMFWARDEYPGGGTFNTFRGYYNTQNLNAADNPLPGFQQVPSIMDAGDCESGGGLLCTAYQTHTSSPSSLEMIGWKDSDGDGVFDVLDVAHTLHGSGHYDPESGVYRFAGSSAVGTLPNLNPSGLQNDITLNVVSRAEYRVDSGPWLTAAEYGEPTATLDLLLDVPATAGTVEIRTIDDATGVHSPVFVGYLDRRGSVPMQGIQGSVWNDENANGVFDRDELPLEGWTVELVDEAQQRIDLQIAVEPDDYPVTGTIINTALPGVMLSAVGGEAPSSSVTTLPDSNAATGDRVFGSVNNSCGGFCAEWSPSRRLRTDLSQPTSAISLDAIGTNRNSYARLEIYDAGDQLLGRATTPALSSGEVATLTLGRPTADIAYAIAYAHVQSTVMFDNLLVGPHSSAVTDSAGAYALANLPPGNYSVRAATSGSLRLTSPETGIHHVSLASAGVVEGLDFGFTDLRSPWQNDVQLDVNNDGFISPADALQIINDLNRLGARELQAEAAPPFLDTNGDFNVSPQDVLLIVNYLNSESGVGEARPAVSTVSPGELLAEGEAGAAAHSAFTVDPPALLNSPTELVGRSSERLPASWSAQVDDYLSSSSGLTELSTLLARSPLDLLAVEVLAREASTTLPASSRR